MMEQILIVCKYYEPLFLPILTAELLVGIVTLYYVIREDRWAEKEFKYDEEWNRKQLEREKRREARKKERMEPLDKDMD